MKQPFFILILVLFGFSQSYCSDKSDDLNEQAAGATDYFVTSISQLNTVSGSVKPGDVVTLRDGTWKDADVLFVGNGTESDPVTYKAETVGGVVFSGTSKMRIAGNHLVVDGFSFENGHPSGGSVIEFRNGSLHAQHSRLTNVSIKDYSPSDKNIDTKWVSLYGYKNRVDHCSFEGKTNSGTTLVVWMNASPDYHLIDNNYFGPRPDLGFNGGETIRIGTSDWSLYSSYTTVEHNLFEECDGEIEIISNKSCHNVYRYNTFLNNNGTLTLRHGDDCEVYNNFFIDKAGKSGSGGVRVIGRRHKVYNNYFEGLNGNGFRAAVSVTNGMPDSPLNGYYQVEDALIGFNTIVNCRQAFAIGSGVSSSLTLPPVNVLVANNLVKTRSNTTMVYMHDASADILWDGNLVDGASGLAAQEGIQMLSFNFSSDGQILRPEASALISNLATSAMPEVNLDIDLQDRPSGSRHVGCDQIDDAPVANRPKRREDVGVRYEGATSIAQNHSPEEVFFFRSNPLSLSVNFNQMEQRALTLFSLEGHLLEHKEGRGTGYNFYAARKPGVYLLRVIKSNLVNTYKVAL